MHTDETWQLYNDNGTPISGIGDTPGNLRGDKTRIVANAHVWFWKKDGDDIEILLQKRALTKSTRPGWYHISAGGHINLSESPLDAALRETKEEMGLTLNADKLHYVHSTRIVAVNPNDIVHVYLYQLTGDEKITHDDGEAESFDWYSIERFDEIAKDAEAHNLVPQGELYFNTLIAAIKYVAKS
jgi:isopentenyl-diphosphate delta-isomerase